mmetsp:Transcript_20269/g.41427  ORF Transcript_20269/g.41427 Transcript_20269/m.41427 type:complete len:207 (+) Transcript_20269:249-869(+)|eukprot:CAMPEP_0119082900 /NCGR_PEP_ID=MMETSP1178-20130426/123485_1 /TAXON_ID=33656 /ORGANISM="unid sp, Strain CCMP2000" /LENGTH=206 /DNA_ID=CAMNT_0007065717 /DNA_START=249 /DNA_END=869 /DNA_ORIENTATION=-
MNAPPDLDGQFDGLVHAALLGLVVVVEKIAVQTCLHDACYPDDPLHVVHLSHVPVNPVEQVEPAVRTERKDVVRRQVLHLAKLLQQKELRQDRHRLEIDGERPDYLKGRVVVLVDDEARKQARANQILDRESVLLGVVGGFLRRAKAHEVDDRERCAYEDNLQHPIVHGRKVPEEVNVPAAEDHCIELLRPKGDARRALSLDNFVQ